MAQSMAAERLASAQAANTGGQAVANSAEVQDDAVKLSSKALNEVSTRNSADSMNRRDDLFGSLMDKLNNEILNPDSEFNQQNEKKKAGKSGEGGGKKKKKVKRKAEWEPSTQDGQIHPGRDVIGKVRVTQEVKDSGADKGGVGGVGKAGGTKSGAKAGTPNYGKAQQSPAAGEQAGAKPSDSKDDNKEAKDSSAAKNLEKSGLKAPELEQDNKRKGSGDKTKIDQQAGEAGGSKVKEYDVKTRATGANQSQQVTPAKELQKGDKFRTFRKLDDKPLLKYATLHKKDFKDNKEAAKELKKNAQAAGESPEAIEQAVQRLKDRTPVES